MNRDLEPIHLRELRITLDRLVYHYDPKTLPAESPHAFIYFLTLENRSSNTVTMLARKWIIESDDGETDIVEGDGIVGKKPTLAPGEKFSWNSYHLTGKGANVRGSLHGIDESGNRIFTMIPAFSMEIPSPEAK